MPTKSNMRQRPRRATPNPSGPLKPPNWPPPFTCGSRSRKTPGIPRRLRRRSSVGMAEAKSRRIAQWPLSPKSAGTKCLSASSSTCPVRWAGLGCR